MTQLVQECAKFRTRSDSPEEDHQIQTEEVPFEMLVLDNALNAITSRFYRTVGLMKPVFNKLMEMAHHSPSDKSLKKLLAFKKSLMAFETR